jgi:conjugal transfer mating pair stabilization protein TraN
MLSLSAAPAWAQMSRDDAKAEATDLAKGARDTAISVTTNSTAASTVPHFAGTTLPESAYQSDPDALIAAGSSSASTSEAVQVVKDPSRPYFDPKTIDVSAAKAIEDDPKAFTGTGISTGGAAGSCEPLPSGGAGSSTYYQSCNQGDQIITTPKTCTSTLNVTIDKVTTWLYYATTTGPFAAKAGFGAALASGVCRSKGTFGYCSEAAARGYSVSGSCKETDYAPEIFECTAQPSGLSSATPGVFTGLDPRTGQYWSSTSETSGPPIITVHNGCASLESNASCEPDGPQVCTDSDPITRIIDGVAVTQPCWAWARSFQCHQRVPGPTTDCTELQSKPECTFDHNECLSTDPDGTCSVSEKVYRCTTPDTGKGTPPSYICSGDLYCLNGECSQVEREASTEFKDAMVAVQTLGDVRDQFDPATVTLFSGEKAGCHKPVFGLVNCCAGKTSGLLTTAAGAAALSGGPAAIAAIATPFLAMFMCSGEEMTLDVKDRMGLCHYVGTYCSDKILGVCTSKRKSYCCFESKLSRILQEQGRAQIGKSWGTPKEPNCKGFLVEEFQQLDLSKMDFTEVYKEFIEAAKLPDEVQTMQDIQARITTYYTDHGAN